MKISIEKTDELMTIDGVPVRRWKGLTERGVECDVLVHRLVVRDGQHEQFAAELEEREFPDKVSPNNPWTKTRLVP